MIWRSWVRTPVGSNFGCVVLLSQVVILEPKYICRLISQPFTFSDIARGIWHTAAINPNLDMCTRYSSQLVSPRQHEIQKFTQHVYAWPAVGLKPQTLWNVIQCSRGDNSMGEGQWGCEMWEDRKLEIFVWEEVMQKREPYIYRCWDKFAKIVCIYMPGIVYWQTNPILNWNLTCLFVCFFYVICMHW